MLSYVSIAQQDLTVNYTPIKSKGKPPKVFLQETEEKINNSAEKDRAGMSTTEERVFLEGIHYHIDELLNSGIVLFGDETTQYVQEVADKLLENEAKLRSELEFYVIKSNVTNALSTDQGIVFVTLGLLSQLENEAQLAYVLSHEIAHYTEKHVEKSYKEHSRTERTDRSYDQRITRLSNHSKEAELEADKLGLRLYHEAGYAQSEIHGVFDVLMYSYLPFDEVALPKDYFNSPQLFVPEKFFPKEINEIKMEEDYDDSKSSHPNIQRRRDKIDDEMEEFSSWGNKLYLLSEEKFNEVRNIARFESVRLDLLNSEISKVMYSIFLLEKEYPNNLYLNRCKAKAWLALASFRNEGLISDVLEKPSSVEGERHAMAHVLRKFTRTHTPIIAMRQIEDISLKFPEDTEIKLIRKRMIRILAESRSFSIGKMSEETFEEAIISLKKLEEEGANDTISSDQEPPKELSKYDKIKSKRTKKTADGVQVIDTAKFYLYALSDLVTNDDFKKEFRKQKDLAQEAKDEEERLRNLSKREWRAEMAEKRESISELVLYEPLFIQMYNGDVQMKESEEKEAQIAKSAKELADKFGIQVYDLTNGEKKARSSNDYNERAILADYIRQRFTYEDIPMFPVDYSALREVRTNYGDAPVMFVFGAYESGRAAGRKRTSFNMILVDLKNAEILLSDENNISSKPKRFIIEAYLYDMMVLLK